MRNLRVGARATMLVATAVAAISCSTNGDQPSGELTQTNTPSGSSQPASPARPTLTAPSLQPPPLHNKNKSPGRADVVFDPCTWIPDDVITRIGYDPKTRKRPGDQIAEQTFLLCTFSNKTSALEVMSGNVTWDEDLQKNGAWIEPITINGREAMWVRDPAITKGRGCDIHLRTKAGFVDVGVGLNLEGAVQGLNACDRLLDIASAIEPTIGKEN